jgi:glycosyltransferase involved in cell wall biosynthesis
MISVSIVMITYNHEKYIREAIEGVLMQKTQFPIQLIIGEDCSTDSTASIVKEYAEKYPDIVKATCNSYNNGGVVNSIKTLQCCTGKYIALCEGDDFWTDPNKLSKQVAFLENNPDYSMVYHNVEVVGQVLQERYFNNDKDFYTTKELVSGEISIPTLSVVFRNYNLTYSAILSKTPIGDFPLFVMLSQYGKIKYFSEIMGSRRVHENGLWSAADKSTKLSYLLITVYYMIGNYNEETNKLLIQYHLKLIADSIKEGVSPDLYPKEMKWVIKIMSYYTKARTFLRNLGLFKIFKFLFRAKKVNL